MARTLCFLGISIAFLDQGQALSGSETIVALCPKGPKKHCRPFFILRARHGKDHERMI